MTKAERDRIFMENYGLVAKVLKDCSGFFGNTGIYTRDDLIQIGSMGLLKAIDSYRTDKNCRFSTYAYLLIRNELINEVMKEVRKHGMETANTDDDDYLSAIDPDAADAEFLEELLHILSIAREKAPDGVRIGIDAIILISQDYSGREIAKLLDVSPGYERVCVSRARKYLQENRFFSAYRT